MCGAMRIVGLLLLAATLVCAQDEAAEEEAPMPQSVIAEGATPQLVGDQFVFTEGPARAADGSVLFSDVRASRRYRWAPDAGEVTLVAEDTGGANGMYFAPNGHLVVCESQRGRITSIAPDGTVTILADQYAGRRFNAPNDLWVAPDGGVYFSDPNYGGGELQQDGEHVYYIPRGGEVMRVVDWMKRPNGLIGTPDGSTVYITDAGAGQTWRFTCGEDGSLCEQALFVEQGGDGMTIDAEGNVYLATDAVVAFNPQGEQIMRVELPVRPTNMCFAGEGLQTLFITARNAVYTLQMRVCGAAR